MQKKKKKNKLFIFLIICFVLLPFLLTKGCNYIGSLNQAKNSVSEPITSTSEQIQPSALVYTHAHTPAITHSRPHNAGAYAHERAHTRTHNASVYAQAHLISKANWTGTAIPNSGYVENIYLNTDLSNEEVISILNSITFIENIPLSGMGGYFIFANSSLQIGVYKYPNGNYSLGALSNSGNVFMFNNNDSTGWQTFDNPFNVNLEALTSFNGFSVGEQNDMLSSLISLTPFEQSSNNELSIGNLFAQLGNAIIIFGGAVVNVFISLEPIFWNEGPTLIFILLIASVSFALVFWGIELLISLIGISRTKRKKKK